MIASLFAVIVEIGQQGGDDPLLEKKQKPNWQSILEQVWGTVREALIPHPSKEQVIWAIRIVVALAVVVTLLICAIRRDLIGSDNAAVIGALLALVGVLITQVVSANVARALEDQRARAASLQSYLNWMGAFLTDSDRADNDARAKVVARAQTLAVLEGLRSDPTRKRSVLQFLNESKLIRSGKPDIDLAGADLRGAYLREAHLNEADLRRAKLIDADLSGAYLNGANLKETNLREANLSRTDLSKVQNLAQAQVDLAIGDENTKLPKGLERPKAWPEDEGA